MYVWYWESYHSEFKLICSFYFEHFSLRKVLLHILNNACLEMYQLYEDFKQGESGKCIQ